MSTHDALIALHESAHEGTPPPDLTTWEHYPAALRIVTNCLGDGLDLVAVALTAGDPEEDSPHV